MYSLLLICFYKISGSCNCGVNTDKSGKGYDYQKYWSYIFDTANPKASNLKATTASLYFISRIGAKEGFSFKNSKWLWMSIFATALGAVSALYDKYLLQFYEPLQVQAWYSLYQLILMGIIVLCLFRSGHAGGAFTWRWAIVGISLFLTAADLAYFYALSLPGSMISIISMIRRGSVLVSFFYGVIILRERHVKAKLIDLSILLLSLTLLVLGS